MIKPSSVFCLSNTIFLRDNLRNIHLIHLPPVASVGGVKNHGSTVYAKAGVQVATPLALRFGRLVEAAEYYGLTGQHVVEIQRLLVIVLIGVGIVKNPLVIGVGQIGLVAVARHGFFSDPLHLPRLIGEQEEAVLSVMLCPGQHVLGVAPDEVRGFAGLIQFVHVAPVYVGGEHAGGVVAAHVLAVGIFFGLHFGG